MEILFSYNNTRCHAKIVSLDEIAKNDDLKNAYNNTNRFIGKINDYSVYALNILFNQFGFFAVKE